jgi:MFS family permease
MPRGVGAPGTPAGKQPGALAVFRAHPAFARFWIARATSVMGDWIIRTVIPIHLARTASPGVVGVLFVVLSAPRMLAPLAGVVADRVDQRRLLAGTEAIAGITALAAMAALDQPGWLLVLVGIGALMSAFFAPAGRSIVPVLVNDSELAAANGLLSMAVTTGVIVGPVIGGFVLATWDVQAALAIDVATFIVSVTLMLTLPSVPADRTGPTSLLDDLRDGLRFVRHDATTRTLLSYLFFIAACASIAVPALVLLMANLDGSTAGRSYGLSISAVGAGVLLGSLIFTRARLAAATSLVLAAVLQAAGLAGLALSPIAGLAILAALVVGVAHGFQNPGADTALQQSTPRNLSGRIFGLAFLALAAGETAGAITGAVLLTHVSDRLVLGLAAATTTALAITVSRQLTSRPVGMTRIDDPTNRHQSENDPNPTTGP